MVRMRMMMAMLATGSLLAGCSAKQERISESAGDDLIVTAQRVGDGSRMQAVPSAPPPPMVIAPSPVAQGATADIAMKSVSRYAWVPPIQPAVDPGRERYDGKEVSPVHVTRAEPVSTFSIDVDTGAYANVRRFLSAGQTPPKDAVRTEELINYFRYDYPLPQTREAPFSVTTDVAVTPWNPETRLLRVGLRGYDLPRKGRPPVNLVFLVDVSGSMNQPDKLPLVKSALSGLADELGANDHVSIVVYAGAAGMVLEPTNDKEKIRAALDRLEAGGSTAGGAGLELAYRVARETFVDGGVNRILLATDGDFNVGISDTKALLEMVEKQRDSGITLTALGFGEGNYNEAMMEQVADHGNGNYAYIDSALEAKKVLGEQMSSTLFTIAGDVKIQVEFNPAAVSQYRLIGYENRALREEDFNNDKVDAGEIGAGHQVTALYEIVPIGGKGWVGPHRYEDAAAPAGPAQAELAFVKLRYKLPGEKASRLIERPVARMALAKAAPPAGDMAFAVAVAAFGQKLRGDPLLGDFSWNRIAALSGGQSDFWRQEFGKLVGLARSQQTGSERRE